MVPFGSSSIYLNSIQLRQQSNELTRMTSAVGNQVREQMDRSVLLRAQARQLFDTAIRFEDLRRENETRGAVLLAFESGTLIDGELCEDPELLARLNALGYECDKCRDAKLLSAVIKFDSMDAAFAVCGDCFSELGRLSLGQVM
jgi:hypothetical protein